MNATVERIRKEFEKKHPDLEITVIANYSKDFFLFEAMENPDKPDMNDPYYLVSKKDGSSIPMIPMANLDAFSNAMESKVIYRL